MGKLSTNNLKEPLKGVFGRLPRWSKRAAALLAVVAIVALALANRSGLSVPLQGQSITSQTIVLERTELSVTLPVSGVVKSSDTHSVYSSQNNPVQEIYVQVGDFVEVGDILAQLDMSRIEHDMAQTELNLQSARNSAAEEARTKGNSVHNARTSLEAAQIALERQILNVANAEKDLREAEEKMREPFDSYAYDKAIEDARINLGRREHDYETARSEYEKIDDFDSYSFENAINDAKKNYQRRQDDEQRAIDNYYDAWNKYYQASPETESVAWNNVQSAKAAMESATRAVEDARAAWERATTDLSRARDNHNRQRNDAITKANENLNKAHNNLDDAHRAYDRALRDREKAGQDYLDNNTKKLDQAKKVLAESRNQLRSAQNNLEAAQNSLNQAGSKGFTYGVSVEQQKLNLEKLQEQLAEGKIVATVEGVITEVNANVGAAANGVLFVIEDADNLYVSANVKEYSLTALQLGQQIYLTTEATGEKVYPGTLIYISPKAVSPAGSTSVEFEIHAALNNDDRESKTADIKIGMNAFLNIMTETKAEVYAVPLSAIVTDERGSFVYSLEEGEIIELAVTVGLRTATQAEILGGGLYDGLVLLTRPKDGGRF